MKNSPFSYLFLFFLLSLFQSSTLSAQCSADAGADRVLCSPVDFFPLLGVEIPGQTVIGWTQVSPVNPILTINDPSTFTPTVYNNVASIPSGDYIFELCVACDLTTTSCDRVKITILPEITSPQISSENNIYDPARGCFMLCEEELFSGTAPLAGTEFSTWSITYPPFGNTYPADHYDVLGNDIRVKNKTGLCSAILRYDICLLEFPQCCKTEEVILCLPDTPDPDPDNNYHIYTPSNPVCSDNFTLRLRGDKPKCLGTHSWQVVSQPANSDPVLFGPPDEDETLVVVCGTGVYTLSHTWTPSGICPGSPVVKEISVLVLPLGTGNSTKVDFIFCDNEIPASTYEFCFDEEPDLTKYSHCEGEDCGLEDIVDYFSYGWSILGNNNGVQIHPDWQRCANLSILADPYIGKGLMFTLEGIQTPVFNEDIIQACFGDHFELDGICFSSSQYRFIANCPLIIESPDTLCNTPFFRGQDYVSFDPDLYEFYSIRNIERPNGNPHNFFKSLFAPWDLSEPGTYKYEIKFELSGLDPATMQPITCTQTEILTIEYRVSALISAGADEVLDCASFCAQLNGSPPVDNSGNPLNLPTVWTYLGNDNNVQIIDPNAHQTEVCGLAPDNSYTFRYTVQGCEEGYDEVIKVVEPCDSCDQAIIDFNAEIVHQNSDPIFDYYTVSGSFFVPTGYEYCSPVCPVEFAAPTDLTWFQKPVFDAPPGFINFTGIAYQLAGIGTGTATLVLELCNTTDSSVCRVEVDVEYEVCPQSCTVIPSIESGPSDVSSILNLSVYLPYGISQDCQLTQGSIGLKYACGPTGSQYYLKLQHDQNPQSFTVPPANSGPVIISFTVSPNELPPCFYVEVNIPACDFQCCQLVCLNEFPYYSQGSGNKKLQPDTEYEAIDPEPKGILIYPNPGISLIDIQLPSKDEGAQSLVVYAANGQRLRALPLAKKSYQLDISQWQSGLYLFVLTQKDGTKITQYFVKNGD